MDKKTYYVATTIKNKSRYYATKRLKTTRSISRALKWKSQRIAKFYVKISNKYLGTNFSVSTVQF